MKKIFIAFAITFACFIISSIFITYNIGIENAALLNSKFISPEIAKQQAIIWNIYSGYFIIASLPVAASIGNLLYQFYKEFTNERFK